VAKLMMGLLPPAHNTAAMSTKYYTLGRFGHMLLLLDHLGCLLEG